MTAQLKKILIVEDEKPIAKALGLKLNFAGFNTEVAVDGEMALEILAKEKFDLILLDLVMPRLNGFAVLETLKNKGLKTPVIVLSNLSQASDELKAEELGAVGFLVKSNVPIKDIVKNIQEILKK